MADEKQIERSPWLEFTSPPSIPSDDDHEKLIRDPDRRLIIPEAWRTQPLPNGGYVELRFANDDDRLDRLWGRAVWPNGLPVEEPAK